MNKVGNLKIYIPEFLLLIIFLFLFSLIVNFSFIQNEYIFIENLINYEGGFVRRGLLGWLAYNFYVILKIPPEFFFKLIYSSAYFFLFYLISQTILELKKHNFYLVILILISPATFFFQIFDTQALLRKEVFFILAIFLHTFIAKKTIYKKISFNTYQSYFYYLIFPILLINILIHEFQFFLLFIHYLINLIIKYFCKQKKIINFLVIYFFLSVVFFIVIFSVNENTVINIEKSLQTFIPHISDNYGPTTMLNGNINLVIGSFLKMIINSNYYEFLQVILAFSLSIFLFLYLFNYLLDKNINNKIKFFKKINHKFVLNILFLLLIFIITAFDYGRLFFILTLHSIAFYLVLPSSYFKFNIIFLSSHLKYLFYLLSYFLLFSLPHAHILMNKGSIINDKGSGFLNLIINLFSPFINKLLN